MVIGILKYLATVTPHYFNHLETIRYSQYIPQILGPVRSTHSVHTNSCMGRAVCEMLSNGNPSVCDPFPTPCEML